MKFIQKAIFGFLLLPFLLASGCTRIDSVISDDVLKDGGEYWETLSLDDRPIGFQRTALSTEQVDGQTVSRFELQSRMIVLRHGSRYDVAMKIDSVSDSNGNFQACDSQLVNAGSPMETRCHVDGEQLIVSGEKSRKELPWERSMAGPEAVFRSLWSRPMKPKEERALSYFDPSRQQIIESTLQAGKIEAVDWGGKKRNLLKIVVKNRMGGGIGSETSSESFSSTVWTDAGGNILRSEMLLGGNMSIVSMRVDREIALAVLDQEPETELGHLGVVPLDKPIPRARDASQLSFIVRLKNASPAGRFPDTPFQNVRIDRLDPNTAKITVRSGVSRETPPTGDPSMKSAGQTAKPEDLESNSLIVLDDPELAKLLATVDFGSRTPWQSALILERLVHETVRPTNFSIAFASSSDVLRSRNGDCTEYAVLLAALCRAKGIPARITLGLVYMPLGSDAVGANPPETSGAKAGMFFHLWNEVLIDGVWCPLDATFALGGADAARIKIVDDSLAGDATAPLVRSILGVLGQLDVNVASPE